MAWLTGWINRKLKTINGSTAGAQTDYQMKMIVHKGSGSDTATDTYLGIHVNNDFSDVRFTSSDGSALLYYWIESYTSGSVATIWIKIPSIPASPSSINIYIYYDNVSAMTTSDAANTFIGFATGGTVTILNQYRIHTFNSSGTLTPEKSMNVETLVVAGGGSGGAGGAGAGGLIYNSSYSVSPGAISVTVGSGGPIPTYGYQGNNGSNSVFGILTTIGGGGGGACAAGSNGGSGGGGGAICVFANGGYPGGAGTVGQGNNGGSGYQLAGSWYAMGGGGGAGAVGSNSIDASGGAGGIGLAYSISGASVYYAGGGGGTSNNNTSGGAGGAGGGGAWNVDAIPNTGGGGGGNYKAGGSGIVIVRYVYRQIVSPEPTFSTIGILEIFQQFDTLMIAGD